MFEKYNQLATYCFRLCKGTLYENGTYDLNINYFLNFSLVCVIIGFIFGFISSKFDDELKDNFWKSFGVAIVCGICGFIGGIVLAPLWSIYLFYILPFILLCFLIFKSDKIIKFAKQKLETKSKSKIIKNVIEDVKCEELAKQVYDSMKTDFPNLKYEDVLNNVKKKV